MATEADPVHCAVAQWRSTPLRTPVVGRQRTYGLESVGDVMILWKQGAILLAECGMKLLV
ncbi:hypothetical protein [Corynebacterium pyruviciproducens]|uniref:Uncharacterized protein n=1 Tax=Corynebacterium pyruviciproducens TaxID=598660 RepID=A0AAF0YSR9_9CORY|nr:hypothetical protein [Corynebacterium pyruviciproducens]WOT02081.1 hypothetical protein CYJ47_12665 [Corynebacterium pyruviciproducens]